MRIIYALLIAILLLGCASQTLQPLKASGIKLEADYPDIKAFIEGKKDYQDMTEESQKAFMSYQRQIEILKILEKSDKITGQQMMNYLEQESVSEIQKVLSNDKTLSHGDRTELINKIATTTSPLSLKVNLNYGFTKEGLFYISSLLINRANGKPPYFLSVTNWTGEKKKMEIDGDYYTFKFRRQNPGEKYQYCFWVEGMGYIPQALLDSKSLLIDTNDCVWNIDSTGHNFYTYPQEYFPGATQSTTSNYDLVIPEEVDHINVYLQKPGPLVDGSSEFLNSVSRANFIKDFESYRTSARSAQSILIISAATDGEAEWLQNKIKYRGQYLKPMRFKDPYSPKNFTGAEVPLN